MAKTTRIKKVCSRGHTYYKSSDCPVCPVCSKSKNKQERADGFPKNLSAPAQRALVNAKVTTLKKLAKYTEDEILELHGIGPSSIPKLRTALQSHGLAFASKDKSSGKPATVSDYIKSFPKETQSALRRIRQAIIKAAPNAEEGIGYGMASYKFAGRPLVYFAGYENHIGFYATPSGHTAFSKELAKYKQGKGSVQFPLSEPLPLTLISKIVKFRMKENQQKSKK